MEKDDGWMDGWMGVMHVVCARLIGGGGRWKALAMGGEVS